MWLGATIWSSALAWPPKRQKVAFQEEFSAQAGHGPASISHVRPRKGKGWIPQHSQGAPQCQVMRCRPDHEHS